MSLTREDFMGAVAAEMSKQPLAAQYYQAGDPRLLSQMGAMATMLAMISQQIDVESGEAFNKGRSTTVLADATLKGILPFARPARVMLSVLNGGATALAIGIGRRLIGPQSLVYVTETSANIAPGATGTVNAKQLTTRAYSHTVTNSVPFYQVEIPPSADAELFISGLLVSIDGVNYPYTPEFANLESGTPGFALETDEYRKLYAKFGWDGTFGVQPANGAAIDFLISESGGKTDLTINAPFSLESIFTAPEQAAQITLAVVLFVGDDPFDVESLRELVHYPSTYDGSAVYLGNFDFLVRRNIKSLRFLCVWNEKIEESVRGASVDNINRLFVSTLMDGAEQAWLEAEVKKVVNAADDSYHLSFVPAIHAVQAVTVSAQVSVVHDEDEVRNNIKTALIALYGANSGNAKKGMLVFSHKAMYTAIKADVVALQDADSDFQVIVPAPVLAVTPEQYRYVTADSITVNITQATYNDGQWSH